MSRLMLLLVLSCLCAIALPQSAGSDDALLTRARALYDAPFARNLKSFDCAVQFDWKQHFIDTIGVVPPSATPVVDRLQSVQHRVFVDHSGAVVSAIPKAPDLSGTPHAGELESALQAMVTGGLNAWVPFGVNEILPIKPTNFKFERDPDGYRVAMNSAGVKATLLLDSDLRLKSGVSESPQSFRFASDFVNGPSGYLLQMVRTAARESPGGQGESKFAYKYQEVEGFQLPSALTVTPPTNEAWHFSLANCKVNKGITLTVAPPPKR